jgi:hypothetical protein
MKKRRSLTLLTVAIVLVIFGLAFAATQKDDQKNEQRTSTAGYKIKGTMEPIPGHSFPKSWGRVVTYFVQPAGAGHRFFGVRGKRWNNPVRASGFGLGQASH